MRVRVSFDGEKRGDAWTTGYGTVQCDESVRALVERHAANLVEVDGRDEEELDGVDVLQSLLDTLQGRFAAEEVDEERTDNSNCGTGAGGFKLGNTCSKNADLNAIVFGDTEPDEEGMNDRQSAAYKYAADKFGRNATFAEPNTTSRQYVEFRWVPRNRKEKAAALELIDWAEREGHLAEFSQLSKDFVLKIAKEQIIAPSIDWRPTETIPEDFYANVFCPTGKGGGVDPTCKKADTARRSKAATYIRTDDPEHLTLLRSLFGARDDGVIDVASAVGAPDDARVEVTIDSALKATIVVKHAEFNAERSVSLTKRPPVMVNEGFYMLYKTGSGLGAKVFMDQVENLQRLGFARINTFAARSQSLNGYYTWLRLGYNNSLDDAVGDRSLKRRLREEFPDAKTVLDVMATKEGRDWWKSAGKSVDVEFDLTPGSRSLRTLAAYLEEKRAQKASVVANVHRDAVDGYDEIEVDEDGDPILPPELTGNVFCKTGKGGGVDPTCKPTVAEAFARKRTEGGTEYFEEVSEGSYKAEFKSDVGNYQVRAELLKHPHGEYWVVDFSKQQYGRPQFKLTGEAGAGAVAVMRSVGAILDAWLDTQNPRKFTFTADSKEPSRVKLYDRFSGLLAKRRGYTLERTVSAVYDGAVKYTLTKAPTVVANAEQRSFEEEWDELELADNAFCPTGKGGGVDPTCGKGDSGLSEKAKRAKAAHVLIDRRIQRYAEEHNEPKFAALISGTSLPDNEPVDIVTGSGGVELKTVVYNSNDKITMKRSAMEKKAKWERENGADVHTVVLDDRDVFNAKGEGDHDESKRVMYYRRGYGSFRIGAMHRVESVEELKRLMELPDDELPDAAKRPDGQKRGRLKRVKK